MSDLPAPEPQVDRGALLGEAYRRGILPPQQRSLYEEGMRRGLFKAPAAPAPAPAPASPAAQASAAAPAEPKPLTPPGAAAYETMRSMAERAPGALREAQESFSSKVKQAQEERRIKQGYEPGVDYDAGTNFADAIQMKRMDNPAEKQAYLTGKYGAGNVFKDKRGQFFVQTPEGKRLSPEGTGFVKNMLAGLYSGAPEIMGGSLGGVLGAAGGPVGVVGGAAIGGAAGKAADEAVKILFGQQRKTLGEEVGSLGRAGVEMGAAEGAGRIATAIPGALGSGFRKFVTGTTPEARQLGATVERAGGAAPLRSIAPGLSSPIQKQDVSTRLGADFLEDRNRAAVHTRLRDIIESTGMPPAEREQAIAEILDPAARVSSREAGEPIVGAIRSQAAQFENDIARTATEADQMLTRQLGRLNALSRRSPSGALGEDVAGGVGQARADFSTAMQKIYSRVDQMIGGQPVVPTGQIKREAKRILQEVPKDAQGNPIFGDPRILKSLQQIDGLAPKITVGDAQRIRTTLGDFGEFTDLTPGIAKRQFERLRQATDVGIGQAAADPAAAPAVRLLRRADQSYSQGIRKFEDTTINKIVSQARTGIMPDPGKVADTILQPQFTARAREIKQMVGERVWRRVAAADWRNVMETARDPQTGEISARKVAAAIQARSKNGLLDLTYEPAIARDMKLYSRRLDARGGKITASALNPDNFAHKMGELEVLQAKQDSFLKTNYLSALSKPGPLADDAVGFILRPGEETRLIEAQRHFGDASPQMTGIRNQALKELLNSAIIRTQTGVGTTVEGEGIEKALRRFTPRQQEILFPGGLADDMRRLAQEIRFMFPAKQDQLGGALIAGMVKNMPLPARLIPLAYYEGLGWIFSQPAVVRSIANGLRPGPGKEATRESIRMIFRAAAAGQLGDAQPQAEQPPAAPAPQAASPVAPPMTVPQAPRRRAPDDEYVEPPSPRRSVGGP